MPGAREAIDAVHAAGGRAIVVTAKYEPNAKLHLEHLGLDADALFGSLWAEAKAEALREHHAQVYVGDHIGDVAGRTPRARCPSRSPPARATPRNCATPVPRWCSRT